MLDFLKRHRKLFITVLAIISLVSAGITIGQRYNPSLVQNSLGFIITPVQSALTYAGRWVSDKVNFVIHMGEMESENRALREQVEELSAENSRLKLVDTENQKLSELLEIDRKYNNYPKIGANVIAKDMDRGSWYNIFVIDKGTKDGLEKDMVVLASGGLAGRIFEVGYNYARVRSIIDDTSAVYSKSARTDDTSAAYIKSVRTDDIGSLRGDSELMKEGKCRMEFLDAQANILVGDEIVTSNLSSVYPPGLTIGSVEEVKVDPIGTKYAIVKTYVDFRHVETVLVITQLFDRQLIDNTGLPEEN